MSQPLPAHQAVRSPGPTPARAWRAAAVAFAVALSLGLAAPEARALSLGRITVQSALGEPLRAEIDIPQITADEVANLRTALASPEAFRAAGIERNPALADLRISLQQRPGGGYFLRLASDRAVNEPFLDLIVEASAPTGRIVREYTLLFDPPSLRQGAAPPAPIAAQITPAEPPAPPATEPAPAAPPPANAATAAPAPTASAPPPAPAPAARASAPAGNAQAARRVTVQSGQTAGAIAAAGKPRNVSLDQMLVSLLRNNPDAFIGGNVNRLKAGAVLEMPTEAQAAEIDSAEARQTLVAQSKDFNEFRQRLAEGVSARAAATPAPGRAATGKVEARVEDKKAAPGTGDRLTLSKGAVEEPSRDGKAAEDRIARQRAERDAAARASEIERNIAELKRLGNEAAPAGAPAPAASAASAAADAGPGLAVPSPLASPGPQAGAASAPASAPGTAPAAGTDAGGPDTLLDETLLPAAAGGALALLLGLALYWRRRRAAASEAVPSDSPLAPDSYFSASSGQGPDAGAEASSMMYSPSQLDAAGDVDPVAEADVYLAYGRDLQAEEILLEALRTTPQRVAVHAKLLEIYARRNDVRAFEPIARDAHALTGGSGPQWSAIAALGRELDPGNALYRTEPAQAPAPMQSSAPAQAEAEPAPAAPSAAPGLDLDVSSFKPAPTPAAPEPGAGRDDPFDFADEPAPASQAHPAANPSLDFDLAGLSLDLDEPAGSASAQAAADPLATKLSLAEEFRTLGDLEGARSLVQEVLAEARGEMRQRAERLLAEIG